jgi:hypothetical protein
MRVRGLIAVCTVLVLCGTPLASARSQDLPSGTVPVEATGSGGAPYSWDTTGFTCDQTPGNTFPIGDTTVNCDDGAGNTPSFVIAVRDTIGPSISGVPSDISTAATSSAGAAVTYSSPTANDIVDGSVGVSCSPGSGATFPAGTTTPVNCSATDSHSNTSSASFNVTVGPWDSTGPIIAVPGDFSVEATSASGAVVTYSASANDAVDGPVPVSCSPASGATLGLGPHTVTCTASDSHTNSSSASFTVSVVDTTPPVITNVPANITKEATSTSGAVATFTNPSANDAVSGSVGVSCSPPSGSTFSITTTTDNCTATDAAGKSSTASFTVTVEDTTPPVINGASVPSDIFLDATSPSGRTVTFATPTATDLGASASVACSPASGSNFPAGTTLVTCTADDGRGNASQAQFHISIAAFDATPPVIAVPSDITTEATSGSGRNVSYSVSFTDPDDTVLSSSCSPVSGSTFALGTTTVNCTATDHHSNTANNSFTVTVQDTTAPTVGNPPADITREASGPGGVSVTFTKPGATDTVDGNNVPVTCTPASGATFALGTTTVDCTATDTHNNSATKSFHVTVQDTSAPVFGAAPDVNADASPGGSTVVTFAKPTATDAVEGDRPVTCTPASGSTFPIGSTLVTCTASDSTGHQASKTFHVIVADRTPPLITVPADMTAEATSGSGAAVTYTFSASDPDDAVSTSSCTPASGSTFAIGVTTVTCNATDSHSNSASKTFKVTITDTTPPTLTDVPADITVEANGPTGSKATYLPPTAVDIVNGPIPSVPCSPVSGTTFPLGSTTVNCSATDSHGNVGTASFKVKVVDTTPPTLIPPGDTSVYATVDTGADPLDEGPISRFLGGYFVSDIADPHPGVAIDHPVFFVVGTTTVKWTATDASGNKTTVTAKLTVLPKPAAGTTPPALPPPSDNRPPANVTNVQARAGDARIIMKWTNPTDADFDHVEITRTTGTRKVVYNGKGATYTDTGLQNDVEVRYVISSVDKSGNHSVGVAVIGVPKRALLRAPADGAKLKKVPVQFVWVAAPKATYYNLQLYLGGSLLLQSTAATPRKVMSVFPTGTVFKFKSPWKWEGKTYKMTKGLYTWYVWPGYGAREDVKYGRLMGAATFQVTQTPAKPKPKPKAKPKKKP